MLQIYSLYKNVHVENDIKYKTNIPLPYPKSMCTHRTQLEQFQNIFVLEGTGAGGP